MRTCAAAHDTGWPKLMALHPCPYDAARRVALARSVELLALLALQAGGWAVGVCRWSWQLYSRCTADGGAGEV